MRPRPPPPLSPRRPSALRSSASEERLADAERSAVEIYGRCEVWELTPAVCELASRVAPRHPIRTLDALHLATYLTARRRLEDLELLTCDERLRDAATLPS